MNASPAGLIVEHHLYFFRARHRRDLLSHALENERAIPRCATFAAIAALSLLAACGPRDANDQGSNGAPDHGAPDLSSMRDMSATPNATSPQLDMAMGGEDMSGDGVAESDMPSMAQVALYRINSGGPAIVSGGWSGDTEEEPSGCLVDSAQTAVASTREVVDVSAVDAVAEIYATERYASSGDLRYRLPISPGEHEVVLHFAEIFARGQMAGFRVHGVEIAGERVEEALDVFAEVAGYTAMSRRYAISTSGAQDVVEIAITRQPGFDSPRLMGIEVFSDAAMDEGVIGCDEAPVEPMPTEEHGIAFDVYDLLLRPGPGFGQVEVSEDAGGSWSAPVGFGALLDGREPGAKFKFSAGHYRGLSGKAKDRMHFMGAQGGEVILSGARDLGAGAWQRMGQGLWFLDVSFERGPTDVSRLLEGTARVRDIFPEDLWIDDVRALHVTSREATRASAERFFIDYGAGDGGAHRVYIGVDPATVSGIDLVTQGYFLVGQQVEDVTVENVILERYASMPNNGPIGGGGAWNERFTKGWKVRYSTLRENHGIGVRLGRGGVLEHCDIYDNGQAGLRAFGSDWEVVNGNRRYLDPVAVVIRNNRIHRNNQLDYDWHYEGGALKISATRAGSTFENNWVHDNRGFGIWYDVDNAAANIRQNLTTDNWGHGIFYEISDGDTVIGRNVSLDNGTMSDTAGAGIYISNSEGIEIRQNYMAGNAGCFLLAQNFGRAPTLADVSVTDNVCVHDRRVNGVRINGQASDNQISNFFRDTDGFVFQGNSYFIDGARPFRWGGSALSVEGWRGVGFDMTSSFSEHAGHPAPEMSPVWFQNSHYGPI